MLVIRRLSENAMMKLLASTYGNLSMTGKPKEAAIPISSLLSPPPHCPV